VTPVVLWPMLSRILSWFRGTPAPKRGFGLFAVADGELGVLEGRDPITHEIRQFPVIPPCRVTKGEYVRLVWDHKSQTLSRVEPCGPSSAG
jgi:hypothetical protein